jgi:hypothetical protein
MRSPASVPVSGSVSDQRNAAREPPATCRPFGPARDFDDDHDDGHDEERRPAL